MLEQMLSHAGFIISTAGSLEDATAMALSQPFDLVLIDKNLPDGNGLELLRKLSERSTDCEFMVMSAYANIESAVQAIRLRVADYLMKPFPSLAEVHGRISRVVTNLLLKRENKRLIEELREKN